VKAQMTVEFLAMVAMSMVIAFGYLYIFGDMYRDIQRDKRSLVMQDFGQSLQLELITASQMTAGFKRTIVLPQKLESFSYTVVTQKNTLSIDFEDGEATFLIPSATGNLVIGQNTIENRNGTLCLNC
jgi:hypothetical protein